MHRWLNQRSLVTGALRLQRHPSSGAGVFALIVLLATPACLNPDISDEDPLTLQAPALDLDGEEGSELPDEPEELTVPAEDDEPDAVVPDRSPADRNSRNPRRRGMGRR